MTSRGRSICWKLVTLKSDKKSAVCDICKSELTYCKNSTTNFMRHLRLKHPFELASYEEHTGTSRMSQHTTPMSGTASSAASTFDSPASTSAGISAATPVPATPASAAISPSASTSTPTVAGPTKQITISAVVERTIKYKPGSARKKELDECILALITTDLQPLSVVENKAFRRLLNKIDPRYENVSRKQLTSRLLPDLYNNERLKLMEKIRQVDHVTITTDCWTSRQVEAYMTVTVHFIDNEWHLHSRVLSTNTLEGSHTGERIASALRDLFTAWGIERKVTTIVTDNAANVKNAVELLKIRHQPCFAHTLNLVVKESIRKTADVFAAKNKVKNIVTFFHHSSLANTALRDAHKTSQTEFRKLKQDVETRWNSTFEMLQSYMFQHDQVTTALCLTGKADLCITVNELEVLRKAMATLEPFYEATVELSTELHTSASKIIPLVHLLSNCLLENTTALGEYLKAQLHEQFRSVNIKDHLRLSTLLDPRFKRDGFPHRDLSDEAVDKLKRVAESILLPQPRQEEEIKETDETAPTPAKKPSLLWSSFDSQRALKERASTRQFTASDIEVRRHLETISLPRDANPLDWWRDYSNSTPRLARIAKDVLGIPATSVPSERLFSKAGELISCRRAALKPKNVDMILFLNNIRD